MKVNFFVFRYWVFSEISKLQRLTVLLNELILNELKDIELELENKLSNNNKFLEKLYNFYPEKENESNFIRNELLEGIKNQYNYEIKDNFHQIVLSSLFITYYSFFETALVSMCRYYEEKMYCSLSLNDLNDKGFIRCKKYFKKVMNINFPDNNQTWSHIVNYNKIRNILSHNSGHIEKPKDIKMLKEYVKNEKSLTIDNNFLILSFDFNQRALSNYSDFFIKLMDVLPIESKL